MYNILKYSFLTVFGSISHSYSYIRMMGIYMVKAYFTMILFYCSLAPGFCGNIRMVIYDYEETITFEHVYDELRRMNTAADGIRDRVLPKDQMSALSACSSDRVKTMFGGSARVRALDAHLRYLSDHKIEVAIISSYSDCDVIMMALDRVGLMQYFRGENIKGKESLSRPRPGETPWSIKSTLIAQQFNQIPAEQRLFIDDDRRNMMDAADNAVAKTPDFSSFGSVYRGLTESQLSWIKDQCQTA